mmetsp:Transcript_96806/g.174853  ORF Transcript_96806/g.174853 Transcript_96806/m.174853 type:complete len:343 (+) Transcript_96806:207-1235(+)
MMFNVDADAFEWSSKKLFSVGENCSTAAPSPALTASCSPPFSPSEPVSRKRVGVRLRRSRRCRREKELCAAPELCLEDAENEESFSFEMSGLASLQDTIAEVLAKHITTADLTPASPSLEALGAPPGLAPPPGLELPSVLEAPAAEEKKKAFAPKAAEGKPKSLLAFNTTTVMLRNIPNKYTRELLAERLHEGFGRDIDFLYLPIDFRNKCNVGYAFVSFRSPDACARFAQEYHLQNAVDKLPGFRSKKVCEVSEARCQGRAENVRRLRASQVMQQLVGKPEWLPLLFDDAGQLEEFPMPTPGSTSEGLVTSMGARREAALGFNYASVSRSCYVPFFFGEVF